MTCDYCRDHVTYPASMDCKHCGRPLTDAQGRTLPPPVSPIRRLLRALFG